MIVISIDGLNWRAAEEVYKDLFKEQSQKKIYCNVRSLTEQQQFNATPPGLITLWSGVHTKNLDGNIFRKTFDNNNPIEFIDKNKIPLDLVFNHFKRCKLYEKVIGPNPYADNTEYWTHYNNLKNMGVKFVPSEELCIFSEVAKRDYDLFWIHSSIVKGAVPFPGPYENSRIPSLISYDIIRKDKQLKRDVYMFGIRRYKEVIKYLLDINPNEIILITSDHGTMIDIPMTTDQIDEIPVIVNRNVDLSDINYQWDIKRLILRLKEME